MDDDARKTNISMLQSMIEAFAHDPEVDLKSLIPRDYASQVQSHESSRKPPESKLALFNRETISSLLYHLSIDPAANICRATDFPLLYTAQRRNKEKPANELAKKDKRALAPDHFVSMLDDVTASSHEVISDLSHEAASLIRKAEEQDASASPSQALITMIRSSHFIWSGTAFGRFVARLSPEIAIKVTYASQSNDHAAYEYLLEHAPDLPVPRPHGLIQLGSLSIMFFSFVQGSTLAKTWPQLDFQQKTSIREQLDSIIRRFRALPRGARPLGMLNGEGVLDVRGIQGDFTPESPIHTVAESEDFVFSYRPWISNVYVQFLQQLLPDTRHEEPCVFTHCDLRPDNIMVSDETGEWRVTGIIDWEEAGFYPAYWEAVKATRTFLANNESDWYLMLPDAISPAKRPALWLVDRLWETQISSLAVLAKHAKTIAQPT